MADMPEIGRLVDIDLRSVWSSEPYNFTPWLASGENLQFLSESLELPGLELVRTEHPVDSFSADIVCRIIDTDHHVLIENQLERTDHTHLGQLLTYAPRFDAKVIIWVARNFTDAHRAALDWLNRITGESYAFFGVEVRAVKIGDSLPAPLFDVVVKPNDWGKISIDRNSVATVNDASNEDNIAFWQGFSQILTERGKVQRRTSKPVKGQNIWIPLTSDSAVYVVLWRSLGQKPGVGAYLGIYGENASLYWNNICSKREQLDHQFGQPLEWSINKSGSVYKVVAPIIPGSNEILNWPQLYEKLIDYVNQFSTVFKGHLAETEAGLQQSA